MRWGNQTPLNLRRQTQFTTLRYRTQSESDGPWAGNRNPPRHASPEPSRTPASSSVYSKRFCSRPVASLWALYLRSELCARTVRDLPRSAGLGILDVRRHIGLDHGIAQTGATIAKQFPPTLICSNGTWMLFGFCSPSRATVSSVRRRPSCYPSPVSFAARVT